VSDVLPAQCDLPGGEPPHDDQEGESYQGRASGE